MMTFGIEAPPKVCECALVALNSIVPAPVKVLAGAWLNAPPICIVPVVAVKAPPVSERPPASTMLAVPPSKLPPETERLPTVSVVPFEVNVPPCTLRAVSIWTELDPLAANDPVEPVAMVNAAVTCSGVDPFWVTVLEYPALMVNVLTVTVEPALRLTGTAPVMTTSSLVCGGCPLLQLPLFDQLLLVAPVQVFVPARAGGPAARSTIVAATTPATRRRARASSPSARSLERPFEKAMTINVDHRRAVDLPHRLARRRRDYA